MSVALSPITTTVHVASGANLRREPLHVSLDDVQGPWTGILGTLVLLGGMLVIALARSHGWWLPGGARAEALLLLAVVGTMVGFEVTVRRVHQRQFDFAAPRTLDRAAWERVLMRMIGLTGSFVAALVLYATLREYGVQIAFVGLSFHHSWYASFFSFVFVAMACMLVAAPFYFYLCERYGRWSPRDDEMLHAAEGYLELLRRRMPSKHFWSFLRAMLVKFFFMPVMVMFWVENTTAFSNALIPFVHPINRMPAEVAVGKLFETLLEALFLLDVSLATIGYAVSTRLLDTHIRWAEPTFLGWAVALACYPPFCKRITEHYFAFIEPQSHWARALADHPALFVMCGTGILILMGIYTASTVMFGLRFSNLTNRGILCRGPYALVRHPAYISKNLAWWLIGLPFLRGPGDCVRLLVWNGLYVLRALTEERHLKRDPHYRDYLTRVRWRFIPGVV